MKDARDGEGMEMFGFFNEVGILSQLSSTLLAKCLPDGVHPSHFAIMNHLVRLGDGRSPIRIAAAMQVTKNTMTHSIKVLSDRGFITVEPDPDDGRGKIVHLTEAGRAFRETAIQSVMERFGEIFEPEHRERMARVMGDLVALRKHLDENR
ncbi:MAG: MarR family winged helix-turn-helix transcriptional regulator [Paracoccaceae bacterium]